jgi:phosphoglycerol transferase
MKICTNIFYFIACFIWLFWFYSLYVFGTVSAEQIFFHLQYGIDSLDFDKKPIINILCKTLITTSLIFVIIFSLKFFFNKACKKVNSTNQLKNKIWHLLPLYIIYVSYDIIYQETKLEYLIFSDKKDFIQENYIDPKNVTINKSNNKNLVLIYVESMEKSYAKEYIYGENLIKELDELPGFEFANFIQTPNTGWTIAGIVGTQCALPLKFILMGQESGSNKSSLAKNFLPAATCLGDILAKSGYHNEYIQGASLAFSGKDLFLKNHGYNVAIGREEWLKTKYKQQDMNEWGMYDDLLLQEARHSLDRLVAANKPFTLTILTLDTHFPKGYLSESCKKSGGQNFHDIIKCSSSEVANFVKYIIDKGYLEHTNIVILGDHLSTPSIHNNLVTTDPNRSIYNKWISKENFIPNKHDITHFDVAPTILDFIGLKVENGKYGLGYSAYGKKNDRPKDMMSNYFKHLNYRSNFYNSLWQVQQ